MEKWSMLAAACLFSQVGAAPLFEQFLPPGQDIFPSSATLVGVLGDEFFRLDLQGPTVVKRGPVSRSPDGTAEIQTEIVSMELTGGRVNPSRAGFRPSSLSGKDRVSTRTSFPAESFFDVFFQIEIDTPQGPPRLLTPAEQVANAGAVRIKMQVTDTHGAGESISPIWIHPDPISILDPNGKPAGTIFHIVHIPHPPEICFPLGITIERQNPDVIPTEIVQLELSGTSLIVSNAQGTFGSIFSLEAQGTELSLELPPGCLGFFHSNPQGGFNSILPVIPKFTFYTG